MMQEWGKRAAKYHRVHHDLADVSDNILVNQKNWLVQKALMGWNASYIIVYKLSLSINLYVDITNCVRFSHH